MFSLSQWGSLYIPTFLRWLYLFTLTKYAPLGRNFCKKHLGECFGSLAIINNSVNTCHDLFITTNLRNPKPSPGIPSLSLHSLMMQQKGVYSLLWVIRGEREAPKWSISYQETLDNWKPQQLYLEITCWDREGLRPHRLPLQAALTLRWTHHCPSKARELDSLGREYGYLTLLFQGLFILEVQSFQYSVFQGNNPMIKSQVFLLMSSIQP